MSADIRGAAPDKCVEKYERAGQYAGVTRITIFCQHGHVMDTYSVSGVQGMAHDYSRLEAIK